MRTLTLSINRHLRAAVAAGGLLLSGGCTLEKSCTLIGCINGISLTLTGTIPSTITVDATGNDGSHSSVTCTGGCTAVALPDFRPSVATIRISWAGGSKTVIVQPTYEATRPNGPDCPPICYTAKVTVDL